MADTKESIEIRLIDLLNADRTLELNLPNPNPETLAKF